VAARLAAFAVLALVPGVGLVGQFALGAGVAAAVFAGIVLVAAPGRMVEMTVRLNKALLGAG
jgi:hypothetical protein